MSKDICKQRLEGGSEGGRSEGLPKGEARITIDVRKGRDTWTDIIIGPVI